MIERACEADVAFRVLAAQQRPDHATIARFVERHENAIAGLFGEVLMLCAHSGLVKVGVIAVDGRKLHANASRNENLEYGQLAREIVQEAKAVDAAEDEFYAEARGDELPEEFSTAQGRRGWLREAKQRTEARTRSPAGPRTWSTRDFTASGANRLWVATSPSCAAGKAWCSAPSPSTIR